MHKSQLHLAIDSMHSGYCWERIFYVNLAFSSCLCLRIASMDFLIRHHPNHRMLWNLLSRSSQTNFEGTIVLISYCFPHWNSCTHASIAVAYYRYWNQSLVTSDCWFEVLLWSYSISFVKVSDSHQYHLVHFHSVVNLSCGIIVIADVMGDLNFLDMSQ